MTKQFRIIKTIRIICIIGIIFTGYDTLVSVIGVLEGKLELKEYYIMPVLALIFIIAGISIIFTRYIICDENLKIKYLIAKKRVYQISEIEKIVEKRLYPFSYLTIFFKDRKRKVLMPMENQIEFQKTINEEISIKS